MKMAAVPSALRQSCDLHGAVAEAEAKREGGKLYQCRGRLWEQAGTLILRVSLTSCANMISPSHFEP